MTDLNTVQMTGGLVDELLGQYCIELERLNYGRETTTFTCAQSAGSVSSWSGTVWRSTS